MRAQVLVQSRRTLIYVALSPGMKAMVGRPQVIKRTEASIGTSRIRGFDPGAGKLVDVRAIPFSLAL